MPDIRNFQIIGIDCAADPENIGVAFARECRTELEVLSIHFGATKNSGTRTQRLQCLADEISGKIEPDTPTLLALDTPLGWPTAMGDILGRHSAGSSCGFPADADPDRFFRRQTDLFVERQTNKSPIEVGADWIARATHSSLRLLGMIRERHWCTMAHEPLTSTVSATPTVWVIEVYPALAGPFFLGVGPPSPDATNRAHSYWETMAEALRTRKGKQKGDRKKTWPQVRHDMRSLITDESPINLSDSAHSQITDTLQHLDHGLDAILCAWTGLRFLLGECVPPMGLSPDQLQREGWIWFDKRVPRYVVDALASTDHRLRSAQPATSTVDPE